MNIIQAVVGDEQAVADIIRRSFAEQAETLGMRESEFPNYVAFETPRAVADAIRGGETAYLLVYEGKPVGTVRCRIGEGSVGAISRLAVLPEHRGNGYGEALMRHAQNALIKQGVGRIEISIVKKFERLQAFYQMLGYRVLRDALYPSLPFEVRHLEKILSEIGSPPSE